MRYLFIVLFIVGQVSLSYAFDLGGFIKKNIPDQPDKKEQSSKSKETKQPSISALTGMVGGTPVEEEIAIGKEISGRLLGASPLVEDDKLQRYLNKVGKLLAMQSGRSDIDWYFGVIESDDINAFAAPGGYIFITRGLYLKFNNEAELAGVLAHEIGHVIKKHHLKLLKKGRAIEAGRGFLSSKLGEGDGSSEAIKKMLGSGAEILARGLDKNAEYEADRIGVVVSTRAGYDSYGLPTVLQEIGHVSDDDSSVELLFKTHPHPDARLTELEDAMRDRFDKYDDGKILEARFYKIKK